MAGQPKLCSRAGQAKYMNPPMHTLDRATCVAVHARLDLLAVPSKTYTAVLEGKMAKVPKSGEVSAKIRRDLKNRPKQVRA